jgi:hypothetical protein
MKYIRLLSIAIWLFGCNAKQPAGQQAAAGKQVIVNIGDSSEEPDYSGIEPDAVIPAGIRIDSIQYMDSTRFLAVDIKYAYPADGAMDAYKQLLTRSIDTMLQTFKHSLDSMGEEYKPDPETAFEPLQHHEFAVSPINFYQDANIVSIRFCISETTAGATHSMNYLASVNYDKRTQKLFSGSDYFNIKTSSDSNLLISLLDKSFRDLREGATDNPWTFYGLSHVDFNVTNSTVTFNFADNALGQGPSMIDCKVNKPELISLINSSYR